MAKSTNTKETEVKINPENGFPVPTESQLKAIVRKFPYLVSPEFGGMAAGETRTLKDGTVLKASKEGTMTPEEVYYSECKKKENLRDGSTKTYEFLMTKYGFDINSKSGYRGDVFTK